MTPLRNPALATGFICLALATASCSGTPDGSKDSAAAPVPSQQPAPFDCAKVMTKQDTENILKRPVRLSRSTSNLPKTCAYIATEAADHASVSVGRQTNFPPMGAAPVSFEGHDARRIDDTKAHPRSCRLFVDLRGAVLTVDVTEVKDADMCGIADNVAHLALTRLPREGS